MPCHDTETAFPHPCDSIFEPFFPGSSFWQHALETAEPLLNGLTTGQKLRDRYKNELSRHKHGSLRLGLYFELLLGFWLEHSGLYDVLAHHKPVRDARTGSTLGEVDWVVRNRESGIIEHWEAAVKFYLAHPNLRGLASFVGPSTKGHDSLHQKLAHMLGHQLRLGIGGPDSEHLKRCCCLKGRLFVPWLPDWPQSKTWGHYSSCLEESHTLKASSEMRDWLASVTDTQLAPGTPVGHWTSPSHVPSFIELVSGNARAAGFLLERTDLVPRVLPKQLWMATLRASEARLLPAWSPSDWASTGQQPFCLVLTRADSPGYLDREALPDQKHHNPVVEWTRFFVVP